MAEEQQNKNSKGIGELFIEFGTKGLPNLLKGLNSVSATFLLTKNAAKQVTEPLKEMYKEAGNTAVGIGKMSALLGASLKDIQSLQSYFTEKNVDPGSMMSGISKMMDTIYDLKHGLGGLDGKMNYAFSELGIDIWEYNEGLEGTLQLYEDIQKATKDLNAVDRQAFLRFAQIPAELGFLFERGEFNKTDALGMSQDEYNRIMNAKEAENRQNIAMQNLKNSFAALTAPIAANTANETAEVINGVRKGEKEAQAKAAGIGLMTTGGALGGGVLGAITGSLLGPLGAIGGAIAGATGGGVAGAKSGTYTLGIGKTIKDSVSGQPTGFALPATLIDIPTPLDLPVKNVPNPGMGILDMKNAALPHNISTLTNSVVNNNTFNITGSNAEQISDKVVEKLDTQSLDYNQFQLEHPPMY